MKETDPLETLHKFRDRYETLGDAASALSISKQYLSDMLRGRRDLSPRLLGKLGLKRVVVKDQAAQ